MLTSLIQRLPFILTLLVILVGGWARFSNLGVKEFWTDELNHYYAAQSLVAGHGLTLPSGEPYRRGAEVTRAVAFTQQYIDDPELAARLPSALLGMVGLVLIATTAWIMGGPWAAVWATALLAIYPEAIHQSRLARFYTYQMALGLIAMLAGWLATRGRLDGASTARGELARCWSWALLALGAFYLAYTIQPTSLPTIVAWGAWVLTLTVLALWQRGTASLRDSVPVQLSVAALLALAVLGIAGIVGPELARWWGLAGYVASWVNTAEYSRFFYFRLLTSTFPWVVSLLPLIAVVAYRRAPRLTLYLLFWFTIPILIHTFLLEQKGARYFLMPLPALFVLVGIAASEVLGGLERGIRGYLGRADGRRPRILSHALVAASGCWAVISLPVVFDEFRSRLTHVDRTSDLRIAGELLAESPETRGIPWGAIDPLVALHLWGRVDFGVYAASLDYALEPAAHHPVPRFPPASGSFLNDYYTGVPIITKPEAARAAYGKYGAVVIALRSTREDAFDADLVATLHREAEDLCSKRCPGVSLYLWRFDRPDASGPESAPGLQPVATNPAGNE